MAGTDPSKLKIDLAQASDQGPRRRDNCDSFGTFPHDGEGLGTSKGQLFVVADAKFRNPAGRDAGKMAIRIIQENYFTYPSDDPLFSLQRAFDTANRQIYQYAQASGLHRKLGATCSAVVLQGRHAYIAHVGDCRIYRVSVRKIEQLTTDHTRVIETVPAGGGDRHPVRKPVLTRALGIKLGVKIDALNRVPLHRDEYFLLCSDGLSTLTLEDIKSVVLSSTPESACQRLVEQARRNGARDDITVQVVKVYQHYREPEVEVYAHIDDFAATISPRPLVFVVTAMLLMSGFLLRQPLYDKVAGLADEAMRRYELIEPATQSTAAFVEIEKRRLSNAEYYLNNNRLQDAQDIYQSILRTDPQHEQAREGLRQVAHGYHTLAERFEAAGNPRTALKYVRLAARLDPDNVVYRTAERTLSVQVERPRRIAAATASPGVVEQLATRKSSSDYLAKPLVNPEVRGIRQSQWKLVGLDEYQDFQIQRQNITFFNNIRIKKAFHKEVYDSVDVHVRAEVFSGRSTSKFGIIFGHQPNSVNPTKDFYLFSVNGDGEYTLQRISSRKIQFLDRGKIPPNTQDSYNTAGLQVKCMGNLVLLYANNELLKMVTLPEPLTETGVGLYADPRLEIEFSNFVVSPAQFEN